jgi:hypothetical protein
VPELPENDQGNLTWNLGVWQLNFLPRKNLEMESREEMTGTGGQEGT